MSTISSAAMEGVQAGISTLKSDTDELQRKVLEDEMKSVKQQLLKQKEELKIESEYSNSLNKLDEIPGDIKQVNLNKLDENNNHNEILNSGIDRKSDLSDIKFDLVTTTELERVKKLKSSNGIIRDNENREILKKNVGTKSELKDFLEKASKRLSAVSSAIDLKQLSILKKNECKNSNGNNLDNDDNNDE